MEFNSFSSNNEQRVYSTETNEAFSLANQQLQSSESAFLGHDQYAAQYHQYNHQQVEYSTQQSHQQTSYGCNCVSDSSQCQYHYYPQFEFCQQQQQSSYFEKKRLEAANKVHETLEDESSSVEMYRREAEQLENGLTEQKEQQASASALPSFNTFLN